MGSGCDGFSGADVAALVREAATLALRGALMRMGAFERDVPISGVGSGAGVGVGGTTNGDAGEAGDAGNAQEGEADPTSVKVKLEHFQLAANKTLPSVSREQRIKYERMRDKYAGVPTKGRRAMREEGASAEMQRGGTVADVGDAVGSTGDQGVDGMSQGGVGSGQAEGAMIL